VPIEELMGGVGSPHTIIHRESACASFGRLETCPTKKQASFFVGQVSNPAN